MHSKKSTRESSSYLYMYKITPRPCQVPGKETQIGVTQQIFERDSDVSFSFTGHQSYCLEPVCMAQVLICGPLAVSWLNYYFEYHSFLGILT
jgi:hypothetical protein